MLFFLQRLRTSLYSSFFNYLLFAAADVVVAQDDTTVKVIMSLKRVFKLLLDATASSEKELGKAEFDLLGQVISIT